VGKRVSAAVAAIAAVGVVAGCGSGDKPPAGPTTSVRTTSAQSVAPGSTFAQCASMTDTDITRATGRTGLQLVAANPFRCSWEARTGGDYTVVFQWFRGISLDERRAQVTLGPATSVQVAGHPGIVWSGPQECEIAVGSGGGDFIDWFLRATAPDGGRPQPCTSLQQLAAATLAKAG
jgi:hypothetical protein